MKLKNVALILFLQSSSLYACFDFSNRRSGYSPVSDGESQHSCSCTSLNCCPSWSFEPVSCGIGMFVAAPIGVLTTLAVIYLPAWIVEQSFKNVGKVEKRSTSSNVVIDYDYSSEEDNCPVNYELIGHLEIKEFELTDHLPPSYTSYQTITDSSYTSDSNPLVSCGTRAYDQIVFTICDNHPLKSECEKNVNKELNHLNMKEWLFALQQLANLTNDSSSVCSNIDGIETPYYLVDGDALCKRNVAEY